MENKTSDNQIVDSSREIVANDISEDENQYSIYNYIKAHPGSLAIIFSSMVAVVTFFCAVHGIYKQQKHFGILEH